MCPVPFFQSSLMLSPLFLKRISRIRLLAAVSLLAVPTVYSQNTPAPQKGEPKVKAKPASTDEA